MGTNFFHGGKPSIKGSGTNLAARAFSAPGYAGVRSGGAAAKDLGAAAGLNKGNLKPIAKTAATDAPGPKV